MSVTTTQIERIEKILSKSTATPGITPKAIASRARVSLPSVYKRVHDLRSRGLEIFTNTRVVKGKKVYYYRLAA